MGLPPPCSASFALCSDGPACSIWPGLGFLRLPLLACILTLKLLLAIQSIRTSPLPEQLAFSHSSRSQLLWVSRLSTRHRVVLAPWGHTVAQGLGFVGSGSHRNPRALGI